jgi:hypothetical protein
MQDERGVPSYTYPLQLGQWQGRPAAAVSTFVTAAEELLVSPQFPPPPSTLNMASSRAWMTTNHGRGRHIHNVSLLNWRSRENLVIRSTGIASPARQCEQRRLLLARILFPLAGALGWLAAFRLLLWPTARATQMGWARAIGKSWGGPYLLAFGPAYLLMYGSAIHPDISPDHVGLDRFITEVWSDPASLICFLLFILATALTAFMARQVLAVLTARDRETVRFHLLALFTSAFAGVLYLGATTLLAP